MHRGFIINNISFDPDPYYEIGKERFELQKTTVQKNLDAFMAGDNILDATKNAGQLVSAGQCPCIYFTLAQGCKQCNCFCSLVV